VRWSGSFVLGLFAFAACYETPRPPCAFLCGNDNSCPSSYFCASDGWCKADGVADGLVCDPTVNDASVVDGPAPDGSIDASDLDAPEDGRPVDAGVDAAAIDAPTDAPTDAPIDAAGAMLTITTPNPLDFGSIAQTTSTTSTVTVRNGGGGPTTALTVAVTGTSFTRVTGASDTCTGQTLAPSTDCSFDVRYAPTGVGSATGVASASAAAGGTVSSNLTGASTASLVSSPGGLNFGPITVGQMASLTLTLSNVGGATTGTITTTAPTGEFTITTDACVTTTVAAGDSCDVTVQFAPTAPGTQSATLTLNATPGGPRPITVTGMGQ